MHKVKLLARRILILVVVCAAAFAGWWFFLRPRGPVIVEWQGYAEADFVKVGPTQQGLLTAAQSGGPAGVLEWIEGSRFRPAANKDIGFEFIAQGETTSLDLTMGDRVMHLKRSP